MIDTQLFVLAMRQKNPPVSLAEIGRILGVTRQRVHQIETAALRNAKAERITKEALAKVDTESMIAHFNRRRQLV